MLFKILSTCRGGGYHYCRTEPPHPNKNAKGLYPLHRVLMENKVGRLLTYNECVHHKNEDKNDNRPENLEIIDRAAHARYHAPKVEMIEFTCPHCGKKAQTRPNFYRRRLKMAKTGVYCSRSCSGRATGARRTG